MGNSIYTDEPILVEKYKNEMNNPIYVCRDTSYYDPIALFVQASRKGTKEQIDEKPYSKSFDEYCNDFGYDYMVTSSDVVHYYGGGFNPYWGAKSERITVDFTVPEASSGYIIIIATSKVGMDVKLGIAEHQRIVAVGVKPLDNSTFLKYKYEASDIVNGKVTLTMDKATNLKVFGVGIQTLSGFAPDAPTGVIQAGQTSDTVSLSWNEVIGAMRYNIYRDGEMIGTSITTSFKDIYAPAGTHNYTVSASSLKDGEGNMSSFAYTN